MKRLITRLALAVGIGLFAGTGSAVAAPPTPNDTSTTTLDCPGFQVEAQATGWSKVIDQFPNNFNESKPLKFYSGTSAASTMTLTGPAPASKVVSYSLNGTVRLAFDFSIGDFVHKATGRNLITVPKVYGTPGIFLAVGQFYWAQNGPVYPNAGLTGPGKITDVCQVLAP